MFRNNNLRLNVLDSDLQSIGAVKRFSSLTIQESFFGVGTWEAEMPLTAKNAALMETFRFVEFNTGTGLAGIVERVERSVDTNGGKIRARGSLLDGIARWRVVVPPDDADQHGWDTAQGTVGEIMSHYINAHLVNPLYSDRKIPRLAVALNNLNVGEQSVAMGRFESVSDVIEDLGKDTRVGWRIRLQRLEDALTGSWSYQMVFETLPSIDRTNGTDSPIVLSVAGRSVEKAVFTRDASNYFNTAYALGKGEFEDRFSLAVSNEDILPAGLFRREVAVDCGNEDDPARIRSVAMQRISDMAQTDTLEISTIPVGSAKNMQVGDIVTVNGRDLWISAMDMLVAQIQRRITSSGESQSVVLGRAPVTFTSKFRQYERLKTTT